MRHRPPIDATSCPLTGHSALLSLRSTPQAWEYHAGSGQLFLHTLWQCACAEWHEDCSEREMSNRMQRGQRGHYNGQGCLEATVRRKRRRVYAG